MLTKNMVQSCCVKNCKSVWIKNGDISFHGFPKDPELFTAFVSAMPPDSVKNITKFSKICSKHFTVDSFQSASTPNFTNRLKRNAVPTLFEYDLSSTITTPIDVVKLPTNSDNTDDQMIVESIHSASLDEMELEQEGTSNYDSLHSETLQQPTPTASLGGKPEVGVQTLQQYLSPSDEVVQLRKKIRVLQKRLQRRDIRKKTMNDLLRHLKNNGKCTDAIEDVLKSRFSSFSFNILANEVKNVSTAPTGKRYSDNIKSFALTLYFYSPKAYDFIRTKLNLPHSSMLQKWLNNYNCEPGFMSEVISYLKEEVKTNADLKNVALIFDSMAIHSQIVYDKKHDKHRGYVDYGGIFHTDSEELAKEALVSQIVSYTKKFKISIAFFFVNKLIADIQSQIVNHALITLQDIGITVRSITSQQTQNVTVYNCYVIFKLTK